MKADNISPQASGDSLREILLAFKTIIQLFYLHHKELCSLIAAIWALGSLLALPYLLRPIPVVRNIVPDDYYIVGFRDLKTLLTPPSFRGVIHFLWPFLPPWDEGLPARVSLLGALLGAMAVDHGLSLLVSTLRKWTIAENVCVFLEARPLPARS